MLLSPHGGVGMLWQITATLFGTVLAARSWGQRPEDRERADLRVVAEKRAARRQHTPSRRSRAALQPVPAASRKTQTFSYAACKRALDLVLGAAFLLAAAPLMGVIALGVGLTLGRPFLFSQQRVGRRGRLFRLYKFRTLAKRSLARSEVEWSAPAPHPLAALLRHTGLDELPQLINVLRGEMSLVGPRPERPHFVKQFQKGLPNYAARHCLQPGITGWAQVHGYRGDTSIARRLEHDLFYLNHWSLGFDLWILLLTLGGLAANLWSFVRGKPLDRRTGMA
jgi:lipopolysaccharide/colanic/teichoic acid biosynthesis glycosyltransferase